MTKKNINIIFHKDASSLEAFSKLLSKISPEQLDEIIKNFSETPISEDSCMHLFEISVNSCMGKSKETHNNIYNKKTLTVSNFYWGGLKFLCEENKIGKDRNNLNRINHCFNNLQSGKCKCSFMLNVIGKTALPELYKTKTK